MWVVVTTQHGGVYYGNNFMLIFAVSEENNSEDYRSCCNSFILTPPNILEPWGHFSPSKVHLQFFCDCKMCVPALLEKVKQCFYEIGFWVPNVWKSTINLRLSVFIDSEASFLPLGNLQRSASVKVV